MVDARDAAQPDAETRDRAGGCLRRAPGRPKAAALRAVSSSGAGLDRLPVAAHRDSAASARPRAPSCRRRCRSRLRRGRAQLFHKMPHEAIENLFRQADVDRYPQARRARRNRGRPDRAHVESRLLQSRGDGDGPFVLADDDGNNRRIAGRHRNARRRKPLAQVSARERTRSRRSGSAAITSRLASSAAATAGGGAVEKMNGRARCSRYSIAHAGPATNAPATPSALPAGFTETNTPSSPCLDQPLPRSP